MPDNNVTHIHGGAKRPRTLTERLGVALGVFALLAVAWLIVLGLVLATKAVAAEPDTTWHRSHASAYGLSDGLMGHRTACGLYVRPDSMFVAHRTLPCGTRLRLAYRDRRVTVTVGDRGPYIAGRDFDLAPGAFRALGARTDLHWGHRDIYWRHLTARERCTPVRCIVPRRWQRASFDPGDYTADPKTGRIIQRGEGAYRLNLALGGPDSPVVE
jgi:3D (Asp-Asp-Asp) domain-containing protein